MKAEEPACHCFRGDQRHEDERALTPEQIREVENAVNWIDRQMEEFITYLKEEAVMTTRLSS